MEANKQARTAINNLFQLMNVTKVICVDDVYARPVELNRIIGLCSCIDAEIAQSVPGLEAIPFEEHRETWIEVLTIVWDGLERNEQVEINRKLTYKALYSAPAGQEASEADRDAYIDRDVKAANVLNDLLDEKIFSELSLTEWRQQRNRILDEIENGKTLFLFDEDLSGDGGSDTEGINLIQDVLSAAGEQNALCGLLSHKFSSSQEFRVWERFKGLGLDQDRVVPLSKDLLYGDPVSFARRVKLTVLNPDCKNLRQRVSGIIKAAQGAAHEAVDEINIYDFDHIVFKASNKEGIWEPDTLFRLFGLFQRRESRKIAKSDTDLHDLAAKIRTVSGISTDSDIEGLEGCSTEIGGQDEEASDVGEIPEPAHLSSWQIQRLEFYEEGDYINSYHLPVELGDIFEKTSGEKSGSKYFLLGQPCDLMVRTTLGGKRRPAITDVILAEIVDEIPRDEKGNIKQPDAYFELPYFNKFTGGSQYIDLRETHHVRLFVLDLCVFNKAGAATFSTDDACANDIVVAWKSHHRKVKSTVREAVNKYGKLNEWKRKAQLSDDYLKLTIPKSSDKELFEGTIDVEKKSLSYDCKRVERLGQLQAAAALLKYSNFNSRPAFDLDFGK
ncbi:MAG: hypothetical protein QOG71_1717 [Pyrinomonadaceae bacterium]|nr:hypothetical protein [Pyrinomonadaceae bacterium]